MVKKLRKHPPHRVTFVADCSFQNTWRGKELAQEERNLLKKTGAIL